MKVTFILHVTPNCQKRIHFGAFGGGGGLFSMPICLCNKMCPHIFTPKHVKIMGGQGFLRVLFAWARMVSKLPRQARIKFSWIQSQWNPSNSQSLSLSDSKNPLKLSSSPGKPHQTSPDVNLGHLNHYCHPNRRVYNSPHRPHLNCRPSWKDNFEI